MATSKKDASKASELLRNPKTRTPVKSVAGSVAVPRGGRRGPRERRTRSSGSAPSHSMWRFCQSIPGD